MGLGNYELLNLGQNFLGMLGNGLSMGFSGGCMGSYGNSYGIGNMLAGGYGVPGTQQMSDGAMIGISLANAFTQMGSMALQSRCYMGPAGGSSSGVTSTSIEKQIEKIDKDIKDYEAKKANPKIDAKFDKAIKDAEESVKKAEKRVSELTSEINSLNTDIGNLQTQIDGEIAKNENKDNKKIDELNKQIKAKQEKINELKAEQTKLNGEENVEGSVKNLQAIVKKAQDAKDKEIERVQAEYGKEIEKLKAKRATLIENYNQNLADKSKVSDKFDYTKYLNDANGIKDEGNLSKKDAVKGFNSAFSKWVNAPEGEKEKYKAQAKAFYSYLNEKYTSEIDDDMRNKYRSLEGKQPWGA